MANAWENCDGGFNERVSYFMIQMQFILLKNTNPSLNRNWEGFNLFNDQLDALYYAGGT